MYFLNPALTTVCVLIQDFSLMRVPGYCLKKESDYYYLVKDSSSQDSHDSDSTSGLLPDISLNVSFSGRP